MAPNAAFSRVLGLSWDPQGARLHPRVANEALFGARGEGDYRGGVVVYTSSRLLIAQVCRLFFLALSLLPCHSWPSAMVEPFGNRCCSKRGALHKQ